MDNYFQLINARLTKDPEIKYTPTQVASCNFTVAIDRNVKTDDGWKTIPSYIRFTVWKDKAENLKTYSAKGLRVNIYGHFESTTKTDSEGNTKTYENKVVDRLTFVDFKKKEEIKDPIPAFNEIEADIPF